jgi:hypothetical protein
LSYITALHLKQNSEKEARNALINFLVLMTRLCKKLYGRGSFDDK